MQTRERTLCQACRKALPWHVQNPLSRELLISVFDYTDPIRQLILAGKSGKQLDKLQLLADLIADTLPGQIAERPQAILPVPLHVSRLRERGFNQSVELAKPLARRLGIPLLLDLVERQRNTGDQKALSASDRQINVLHAFKLRHSLPYQHIALFDDVLTTGSTCAELQTLLLAHGVTKVQIWTCARTKQ
ncbi:MAG: ComF family protein [Thiolinea sp.]